MAVITSTGTKYSIVAEAPATEDAAGYADLTFIRVGHVTNIPEFGPNTQVVTLDELDNEFTQKYKGQTDNGSMSIEAAYNEEDAGQILASTGVTGVNKYASFSMKLEYQDGSVRYWQGRIFSYTENPGSANSMVSTTFQVEINTAIIKVAA